MRLEGVAASSLESGDIRFPMRGVTSQVHGKDGEMTPSPKPYYLVSDIYLMCPKLYSPHLTQHGTSSTGW